MYCNEKKFCSDDAHEEKIKRGTSCAVQHTGSNRLMAVFWGGRRRENGECYFPRLLAPV